MTTKHFISGAECSYEELKALVTDAINYKAGAMPDLKGAILTLVFANPSLRTMLSFESGMKKLGGHVNVMNAANMWQFEYRDGAVMNEGFQEHIKEAARVISRYTDVIGLRNSELITTGASVDKVVSWSDLKQDMPITQLARYATKPVINMESNMYHPCQGMADVMTLAERFGGPEGVRKKKYVLTWAPHPKPLPLATPHSQMLTPAMFGMDVTVACPDGYDLDGEVVALAKQRAETVGGSLSVVHDQKKAFEDADVVVAKSWASLAYFGDWKKEAAHRAAFADWTVRAETMAKTNNAYFMHCLPVRRNVVVTDEVLDSPRSLIIDEAENRMWIQMAIINYLLGRNL